MKVVEKTARDEMSEEAGEAAAGRPHVEVVAKAERRRFTAEYKRRIVREADRCTKPGEIGALLRREGLYSSHLTTWRAARDRGELEGLSPKQRGPKATPPDPREKTIAEQERQIARLSKRAERAEALVELQKNSRCCWGPRSRARNDDGDGPRGRAVARDRADVRGAGPAERDVLPASQAEACPRPAPESAAHARRCGARRRAGGAARARLRRSGPGAGVRTPSRCRALPLLGADHVPHPGRESLGAGAAGSAAPPALLGSRAPGDGTEPGVELGHHQAARTGEVDLLLPLRDPGLMWSTWLCGVSLSSPRSRSLLRPSDST